MSLKISKRFYIQLCLFTNYTTTVVSKSTKIHSKRRTT